MSLDDDAREELRQLAASHRLRVPRVLDSAQGPRVVVDGAELINLASNDYLGLAADPRLAAAVVAALGDGVGWGAGSSRLLIGSHRLHHALEAALADWLRCRGVRLFSSGYAANVGAVTALVGPGDVVISDALNHASIIDGCRLSRAEVIVVPHGDLAAIERALVASTGRRRRLIASESLFSMDGDIVDVAALCALRDRHGAALLLDEAHAVGVLGPEGRGVAAAAGCVPDIVIGTFGKALGSTGAFAATTAAIAELFWNRSRSFVFSTGAPPALSAAGLAALEIVRGSEGDGLRAAVHRNANGLRQWVHGAGGAPDSPIIPLVVGDDQRVVELAAVMREAGVLALGVRPPTVPVGTARLRISISAAHRDADLARAATVLDNAMRQEAAT